MPNNPSMDKMLEIFKANPGDGEKFRMLEEYYQLASAWEPLVAVYNLRAKFLHKDGSDEASQLYFRQGEILEKRLGKRDEALNAYEQAYLVSARNEESFQAFLQLAEGLQKWERIVKALEYRLDKSTSKSAKSGVLLQMAKYLRERLRDKDRAKAAVKKALEIDDQNPQPVQLLEKIYLEEQDWDSLVNLHYLQYKRESAKDKKIFHLRQCAILCEKQLQYLPRAIEYYSEIVKLDSNDVPALQALESLYTLTEHWDKVVAVMEQQAALLKEKAEKAKLLSRIALFWSEKLQDLVQAARCYERVLELQEDEMALEILEETYAFQKNWAKLAKILERRSKLTKSSDEKKAFFLRIAQTLEEKLTDPKGAIPWYNAALQEGPGDIATIKNLQRLLKMHGKLDELLVVYRKELALVAAKNDKLNLYHEIARLLIEHKRLKEVMDLYEEALSLYPQEMSLFARLRELYQQNNLPDKLLHTWIRESEQRQGQERVAAYLEIAKLLQTTLQREREAITYYQKVLELEPENLSVLQILKGYYAKQQAYPQLVDTIVKIGQVDATTLLAGYLEISRIYREKLKDGAAAVRSYRKVLELSPQYLDAWRALRELYLEQEQWEPYLDACQKLLGLIPGLTERLAIHKALCDFYRKKNNLERLTHHLREILKIKPDEMETIAQLQEIYRKTLDWEPLVKILELEATLVLEDADKMAQRYREIAGHYYKELQQYAPAIGYYEKAIVLIPSHLETIRALAGLYQAGEHFGKLATLLELEAKFAPDAGQYVAALVRCAGVYDKSLKNQAKAVAVYEAALTKATENQEIITELDRLYRALGEFEALSIFYNRHIRLVGDPHLKLALHLQAAQLGRQELRNSLYAIAHYEAILSLQPEHLEALSALVDLYRLEQKWELLARAYEKKIALTQDQEEKKALWYDLALLAQNQLKWPERAMVGFQELLQLDAKNLKAILAMETLCREEKLWEQLVATLQRKVALTGKTEAQKEIFLEMGKICAQETFQIAKAIEFYEEAAKRDAQNLSLWQTLHELYRQTSNPKRLVEVLAQEIKLTDKNNTQGIWFELAAGYRQLGNLPEAAKALEQVLAGDAHNQEAFEKLASLYRETKQHKELLELWERQIYTLDLPQQKSLALQMASLLENELRDAGRAKELLRQAIELDPVYPQARDALAALYRHSEDTKAILQLYEDELNKEIPLSRKTWLYRLLGDTWLQQGDLEQALSKFEAFLTITPNDLAVIKHVQDIYRQKAMWPHLASAYERELDVTSIARERRIALLLQSAALHERELADEEKAQEDYAAVLADSLDPHNKIALHGLIRVYQKLNDYQALDKVLLKLLDLEKDQSQRTQWEQEVAQWREEKLHDIAGAIEYFQKVHVARPQDLAILDRLKPLLAQAERWPEYGELVEEELKLRPLPDSQLALHKELMHIYQDKLEQTAKAIAHGEAAWQAQAEAETVLYLQSLYGKAGNTRALADMYLQEARLKLASGPKDRLIFLYLEAGKILQSLDAAQAVACFEEVIGLQPTHGEALSALVELLHQLQQWDKLIRIYELTASLSPSRLEKEDLQVKIAVLWETEFKDTDKALLHYQLAYQINPKNLAAARGMRLIFEKEQQWSPAIEMLEAEVPLVEEKKRPALYLKLGEIWEEQLKILPEAVRCYLRIMEHGFHRPTAERITRLQETLDDWAGVAAILEKDVRLTDLKSEELSAKLLKLAEIYYQKLHQPDDAIRVYSALLKLEAQHEEALQAMENLLAQKEEWVGLTGVLKRRITNAKEPKLLFELQQKLGGIYCDKLHQGQYAMGYYEKALELFPQTIELIHTLQALYQEWGCFDKLVNLYAAEMALSQEQERQHELYRLSGAVWETRLFDPYQAIAHYQKLWESAADVPAAHTLASLYRRCQLVDKLQAVLVFLLEDAQKNNDLAGEIALNHELGEVCGKLGQPDRATTHFERVLELELLHEDAFKSLESLYKQQNRYADLVNLLEEKARLITEPGRAVPIHCQRGQIYETKLALPDKAIAAFEQVLQLEPQHPQALARLHHLYLTAQNWQELARIAQIELQIAASAEQKAELFYLLGKLQADHFQDNAAAQECLSSALAVVANHIPSLHKMFEIAQSEKRWEDAVGYLSHTHEALEQPYEKVIVLVSLGTLLLKKLSQPDKAVEMFQEALRLAPDSIEALEPLIVYYIGKNKWSEAEPLLARLAELISQKAELPQEKLGKLAFLGNAVGQRDFSNQHLADIYYSWGQAAEALDKTEEALGRYLKSSQLLPDTIEPLLALGKIYLARNNFQDAQAVYERAYKMKGGDEAEFLEKLGFVEEKLGRYSQAIFYLEKLLGLRPTATAELLKTVSQLYVKNKDSASALPYLEKIVQGDFGATDKFWACQQQGMILAELKEHEKAIRAYLAALEHNQQDRETPTLLVPCYMAQGDWENAGQWNQKCYAMANDQAGRIKNRLTHARILWEGMKDTAQAVATYEEALTLDPSCLAAIKGITDIYLKKQAWQCLAQSYQNFLAKLPEDKKSMGLPIHIALGHLLNEQLQDPKGAIAQFEKALAVEPDHLEIQVAITELKTQDPSFREDASQGHRALLRRDPWRVQSYRSLYGLLKKSDQSDLAVRAFRALSLLDPQHHEENVLGDRLLPRKPAAVPAEAVAQFLIPSRITALRELMILTGEHQESVYPSDLTTKYGVRKKEHLGAESVQRPVWYYTYNTMQILGLKEVMMYIVAQKTQQVVIENTVPPSIMISQALIDRFAPEELPYLAAKYLFYIFQKQHLAYKLQPEELQVYFYILRSGFVAAKEELTAEAKTLQKKVLGNLPRNVRKLLETRSDLWEATAAVNIPQYLKCLEYASNRLMLLLSDSLEMAVRMVYHLWLIEKGKSLPRTQKLAIDELKEIDGISDLLLFNMSDQYGKLRKACNIAMG